MSSAAPTTEEILHAPKPIGARISTADVRALFACNTSPDAYMQCILGALKDAGAPVEGTIRLRLSHGAVAKVKDSVLQEQDYFEYIWLSEEYVAAIASGAGGMA